MLDKLVSTLTRDQLLAAITDPSVTDDTLRKALIHCLNGSAAPVAAAVAPPHSKKAKAPKAALVAVLTAEQIAAQARAAIARTAPAVPAAPSAADAVVGALLASGAGFAVADVIAAGGGTRSQVGTAIKHAMKAGTCFRAGERRFTRYAASEAVAAAASTGARA